MYVLLVGDIFDIRFKSELHIFPQVKLDILQVCARLQKPWHTYEEGVGGAIACQEVHCVGVKPKPQSHGQHQQSRHLGIDKLLNQKWFMC